MEAEFDIRFIVGLHVEVRAYAVSNYDGTVYRVSNPNQGPMGGWTYYNSGTGYANGNTDGWTDALNLYLATGQCSDHWDIWVDGRQMCKDGQRVEQT